MNKVLNFWYWKSKFKYHTVNSNETDRNNEPCTNSNVTRFAKRRKQPIVRMTDIKMPIITTLTYLNSVLSIALEITMPILREWNLNSWKISIFLKVKNRKRRNKRNSVMHSRLFAIATESFNGWNAMDRHYNYVFCIHVIFCCYIDNAIT